jgi:hypothetical protein
VSDTRTSLELLDRSIPVASMPAIALYPLVVERFSADWPRQRNSIAKAAYLRWDAWR